MTQKSKNKRKYKISDEEREARSVRARNQPRLPNGRFCLLKDPDTKKSHHFLKLPLEIRFMIYDYVFGSESGCVGSQTLFSRFCGDQLKKINLTTALLRTNHQIYHEATPFLFRSTISVAIPRWELLDSFVTTQQPLPTCARPQCQPFQLRPRIEKLYWDLEAVTSPHLLQIGNRGGLPIMHLKLVASDYFDYYDDHRQVDTFVAKLAPYGITVAKAFTICGREFQDSLKSFLRSRECVDMIDHLNLKRKPSRILMAHHIYFDIVSWAVQWSAKVEAATGNGADDLSASTGAYTDQALSFAVLKTLHLSDWDLALDNIFPGVAIGTVPAEGFDSLC